MNFTKRESAVSPVIGTILLVAIAVVLVAIILAVVMGFSGDPNEKKVGLNAQPESGANATLILYGGASIDELIKLEMIDQGSANGTYVPLWKKDSDTIFVGLPYLAEGVARPLEPMAVYGTRINVKGTFSDGTEVILLVQPMTFYDVGGTGGSDVTPGPTPEPEPAADPKDYFKQITFATWDIPGQAYHLLDLVTIEPGEKITLGQKFARPSPWAMLYCYVIKTANSEGRTPTKVYMKMGTNMRESTTIGSLTPLNNVNGKAEIGTYDASGRLETEILLILSDDAGEIVRFTWPLVVDKNIAEDVTIG